MTIWKGGVAEGADAHESTVRKTTWDGSHAAVGPVYSYDATAPATFAFTHQHKGAGNWSCLGLGMYCMAVARPVPVYSTNTAICVQQHARFWTTRPT